MEVIVAVTGATRSRGELARHSANGSGAEFGALKYRQHPTNGRSQGEAAKAMRRQ